MENRRRWILAEGDDDAAVIRAVARAHGFLDRFEVIAGDGYPALKVQLTTRLKASVGELERFAVLLDADDDAVKRYAALQAILAEAPWSFPFPALPVMQGVVATGADGIRAGLWVMPDNERSGAVEGFLEHLVPESATAAFGRARDFIVGEPTAMGRNDRWVCKARLHAWLAAQVVPGLQFGSAIRATYLDAHRENGLLLAAWLRKALVD